MKNPVVEIFPCTRRVGQAMDAPRGNPYSFEQLPAAALGWSLLRIHQGRRPQLPENPSSTGLYWAGTCGMRPL
jgi:hypothetical protein